MRLLYCDESNLDKRETDFFVYGGLVIDTEVAFSLSSAIEKIRIDAGVPRDFILKFNPGPKNFKHEQFIQVKQAIIEAAVAHGCIFLASMILHNIATTPDEARRNEINRLCLHFQYWLNGERDFGLVLIDQFDDKKIDSHLREKFLIGATKLPYPPHEVRFTQILGFHYAAIGQSRFGSLVDIVLGSFRFAINAFTRGSSGQLATAAKMLAMVSPMLYRLPNGRVSELSLFFSPKVIKTTTYRMKYAGLREFFIQHGIEPDQQITNERRY
jgi:hypothetical protein